MSEENPTPQQDDQIVTDQSVSKLSDLWKHEDYLSIWLGFIILAAALFLFIPEGNDDVKQKISDANSTLLNEAKRAPFRTIEWHLALDKKSNLKASSSDIGKLIKNLTARPKSWISNPLDAIYRNEEKSNLKIITGVSFEFKRFIETRKQVHPPEGYFEKPIDRDELLKKVNQLLDIEQE